MKIIYGTMSRNSYGLLGWDNEMQMAHCDLNRWSHPIRPLRILKNWQTNMVRTIALVLLPALFVRLKMGLNLWNESPNTALWNGEFYQVMKKQFMDLMVPWETS